MLSYLQKFNALPPEIKKAISTPEASKRLAEIGTAYGVDLASTVMRVMVKEIAFDSLGAYLVNQFNLPSERARAIENELRKHIFSPVIEYLLGASAGPKLVFSEEDEREVGPVVSNEHSDFDASIEKSLDAIVVKAHVDLSDPLTAGKFKQVLKSYLRGARDKKATLEALSKASELGGVALSRDAAERALGVADLELSNLKKTNLPPRPKLAVPEDIHHASVVKDASPFKKIVRETDYDLSKAIEQGIVKKDETVKAAPVLDLSHELAPPVPTIVTPVSVKAPVVKKTPPLARTIIKEAVVGKPLDKQGLRKVAAQNPPAAPLINYQSSASGKIRMDDVRFTPQVLSPVDELKYMSLKTFRRLNPNPLKATEKIQEKLEMLGRDEYAKKIDGIVAWQESPLNKVYLSICRAALEAGTPITEVLKAELKRDPLALKPEELSAIIALNRALKF